MQMFNVLLLGIAIPLQGVIIPVYYLIVKVGLYDTLWAIILPAIAFAIPLTVLILVNFLRDVPNELFESMRLDGATDWRMLWSLVVPLSKPAIITVAVYDALNVWNGFLFPLILTQSSDKRVLPLSLWTLPGRLHHQHPGRPGRRRAVRAADVRRLRRRPSPARLRPHRRLHQVTLRNRLPTPSRRYIMQPWQDPSRDVEERVDALMAELTLEEKAGQLGSFWPVPPRRVDEGVGDVAPMSTAFAQGTPWEEAVAHGLGHITRNYGAGPISVPDGIAQLRRLQGGVVAASRLGIPAIVHEECLTGFTALGATVYPAAIAWGATFDPELVRRMATAIGADMRAVGVHQGLSPLLDVVRDYRWGRVEETCGEDPYLVGTLGSAYVEGLQSAGVIATLKHFVGYSASKARPQPRPGPDGPPRTRGRHAAAVRDGRPGRHRFGDELLHRHRRGARSGPSVELLTTVLRERWGFTGTVVSDYWAVTFLKLMHRVAADDAEAGRLALTAGIDVELPNTSAYALLADEVRAGRLDEALVDRAARRVLLQKAQLGLLDAEWDARQQGAGPRPRLRREPRHRPRPGRGVDHPARQRRDPAARPEHHGRAARARAATTRAPSWAATPSPTTSCRRYDGAGLGIDVPSLADALGAAPRRPANLSSPQGVGHPRPGPNAASPRPSPPPGPATSPIVAVGDLAGLFGRGTSGEGCDVGRPPAARHPGRTRRTRPATGTPVVLLVISGRPVRAGCLRRPLRRDRPGVHARRRRPPAPSPASSPVGSTPAAGYPSASPTTPAASPEPTWQRHSPGTPTVSPTSTRARCSRSATASATPPSDSPTCA